MSDYTRCRWVLATKRRGRTFDMMVAADDLGFIKKHFDDITTESRPDVEQVAIFTRGQWNGKRDSMRYHKNLKERNDPIPRGIGMWVINQANSTDL